MIDKPAGLVVHPGAGHASGTLVDALAGMVAGGEPGGPGIVHRLDRDTSGLMVVARSQEAYERLTELVREHALERTYTALVQGRPRSRTGRIEAPIGRDRGDPTRVSLDTDTPREAITHFEVIELWPEHALLRVTLETGRMHQIRVHLAAIDLPVVGDPVYGVPEPALGRQFLHASELAFPHPFSGERIETSLGAPARPGRVPRPARLSAAAATMPSSNVPSTGGNPSVDGGRAHPASTEAPPEQCNPNRERGSHARRLHEGTAGGRRSLRPPDAPLEPEDEALHLHRARRHLHHRPHPDAGAARRGLRLREGDRRAERLGALRRHEEAGAGRGARRGAPRRHAVRQPPLARRAADELAHDLRPDPAPARAARAEDRGPARPAAGQGAHRDGGRAREARGEPRRCRRHAPPAGRDLHRRPAQGAARRARGAAPRTCR